MSTNKKMMIGLIVFLLAGVCILGFYYITNRPFANQTKQASDSNTTSQERDTNVTASPTNDHKNSDLPSTPSNTTTNKAASLVINSLSQAGNTVNINTQINNLNPIKCTFTFSSPNSRPVVREVAPSGGQCPEVQIPAVEFDKLGNWTLDVKAYDSTTNVNATDIINIQ